LTRKQTRTAIIMGSLAVLGIAVGLVLYAIRDSVVFFYTPSEIAEKNVGAGTRIRLGGLVEKGSLVRGDGASVEFSVTDTIKSMKVGYVGQLPDLFREGQGVVAEGAMEFFAQTRFWPNTTKNTCQRTFRTSSRKRASGRTQSRNHPECGAFQAKYLKNHQKATCITENSRLGHVAVAQDFLCSAHSSFEWRFPCL
jgi:cytochrome c-type biogenesis protein CcmE